VSNDRVAGAAEGDDLAAARQAVAVVTPRFLRLLRESDPQRRALEAWSVGEVACHVSHVFRVDTDALAGRPVPVTELRPDAVAAMNEAQLVVNPERDPAVLAGRIETLLSEFLEASRAPAADPVTWLDGVRIPASAAAGHLLVEVLVHGWDIAKAGGRAWEIDPQHATLALMRGGGPILNAAGPQAFVNRKLAQGFRARFDIRLRGQGRVSFEFDDGFRIGGPMTGPVDAHVSVDPSGALLLMLGRVSVIRLALQGKVFAWGRRPWLLRRALSVITPP
jgi:uncharacterized protein (TIGR03083 family)